MRRVVSVLLLLLLPSGVSAYTLHSAVTPACHESITLEAFDLVPAPPLAVVADSESRWRPLALNLRETFEMTGPEDDASLLMVTSATLGVRDPDLRGNSPADIRDLRHIHLAEDGQADHFLRRSEHDGRAGLEDAAAEAQRRFWTLIEASERAYRADPDATRLVRVEARVQHYGTVEIEVWEPVFLLAQALHLVQDSFTHSYRSDDLRTVLTIQNFVEAVYVDVDRERDGPPHSNALDDCTNPEVAPVRETTVRASSELIAATYTFWREGQRDELEIFLSDWMQLESRCATEECTSRWVAIAQRSETRPLGCGIVPGRSGAGYLAVLAAAAVLARRQRRRPTA